MSAPSFYLWRDKTLASPSAGLHERVLEDPLSQRRKRAWFIWAGPEIAKLHKFVFTEHADVIIGSVRRDANPRRYRNPPIEHRFRKGVSGNPRGRPRKTRPLVGTKIGGKQSVGFEDRVKSLAIEEAYRIIKIREGDRVEKVPVIQAIIRKVAVAAANGNTRAQQT